MEKYFHAARKKGPYFEGWYFKFQTGDGQAIALIPALHVDRDGRPTASLQVLTPAGAWWLPYPASTFHAAEDRLRVSIGPNLLTAKGVRLDVDRDGLSLHGTVQCGPLSPLRSDIMGPFRFFPGMECAHGVISMAHPLHGHLDLNGQRLSFSGGMGYIETDRGRSFPKAYLWTQCGWKAPNPTSLMLSVATIPYGGFSFPGCIASVLHNGREYRLATYRGAKIEHVSKQGAVIRQGRDLLAAELLEDRGHALRAPVNGAMDRVIQESLRATLRYRFWHGGKLLLDHTDPGGSFEYADQRPGPAQAAGNSRSFPT